MNYICCIPNDKMRCSCNRNKSKTKHYKQWPLPRCSTKIHLTFAARIAAGCEASVSVSSGEGALASLFNWQCR